MSHVLNNLEIYIDLKVFNSFEMFESLEAYDQLFSNKLANSLGIEL